MGRLVGRGLNERDIGFALNKDDIAGIDVGSLQSGRPQEQLVHFPVGAKAGVLEGLLAGYVVDTDRRPGNMGLPGPEILADALDQLLSQALSMALGPYGQ